MLQITIPAMEQFDDEKEEFISTKEQTLLLEHSLVSLSKWESKWCKPFFTKEEKSYEETIDYIRCMTVTQNVKPEVYYGVTSKNIDDVLKYIDAPMTATTLPNRKKTGPNREQITSELIYYWMIAFNIPFECQKWHLNRLITLIEVCEIKNSPPKKMSNGELMNRNRVLNAANRKRFNTKG